MPATLLDKENFKIDSKSRQVQDANAVVNGQHVSIKVKINPEGDVREYVSGVPAACIGQQLFTYHAALRETQKIGKSLPEDQSALEAAIATVSGETEIKKYKNYLQKTAIQFAGCYSSGLHVFDDIGLRSYYWLADGSRVALSADTWSVARRDETMGYLISLEK